jgi:hypothetical protein
MEVHTMSEETEMIALGGNIELAGFRGLDRDTMVVVKKIVGNYGRKFSDRSENFEKLRVTRKPVHSTEKSEINEIKTMLVDGGKQFHAEENERNLFVGLDSAMKSLMNQTDNE